METIWIKPVDYFAGSPDVIFYKEINPLGKVFLLAVDSKNKIVAGIRLKTLK